MGSLVEITADGTFPTPLKFYNDAILYDVAGGDGGTVTGDGVFTVAQFSNYPYDPFTTLSVIDDWLEVGAERNTVNDSWTVSFRTKNDNLYDLTSGVVKLADFVGGVDYPLTSSVVNGLTNIRWGFYDTNIQTNTVNANNLSVDTNTVTHFHGDTPSGNFGYFTLDLKGDYAVTSGYNNSYSAKINIYKHNGSTWSLLKTLSYSDTGLPVTTAGYNGWGAGAIFNSTTDKLFVEARYHDYDSQTDSGVVVLFSTNNDWTTVTPTIISLKGSVYEGYSLINDKFGYTLALSSDDNILIVGSEGYESNDGGGTTYPHGAALVFYTTDNWSTVSEPVNANDGILHPIQIGDAEVPVNPSLPYYGRIISVEYYNDGSNSGYICAIGVPFSQNNSYSEGLVKIYKSNSTGTVWSHVTDIAQNDNDGNNEYMAFGNSVDLVDEYLFVGAPGAGPGGTYDSYYNGAVFVYKTSNYTTWTLIKRIEPPSGETGSHFGAYLSAYQNNLVVSGITNDYMSVYSKYKGGSLDDWGFVQKIQSTYTNGGWHTGQVKINESYVALIMTYTDVGGTDTGSLSLYDYSGSVGPSTIYYTNANYYKPSGSDNYTADNTSSSSSGIVTVTPSVSTLYNNADTTLHTSLYNPDTTTGADGERVTKLTNLDIDLNSYGSILSFYTQHPSSNGLYLGNDLSYDGWESSSNVIPYNDGSNTVNYVKSITITSPSFNSNITYFINPASGWYYYQSVGGVTGYVTLHFDAIDNVTITPGAVDSLQIAEFNISGNDLTNFIDQLSIASAAANPATLNIYYTNVTTTSSTDTYFDRYKASQTGYDGSFHFRIKESSSTYSTNAKNYLINLRGAFYDTGNSLYVTRDPTNLTNIDATEFFGRNIQLYTRLEGKLYIVNGKRYADGANNVFPYDPYNGSYGQLWTGLKKYSMTSSLFSITTTYFTDVQSGWTYSQTDNGNGTITLSFEYTADTTNGYTIANGTNYIAKSAINIDILSDIMRKPYSTTYPYVTFSYEYHGSEGTLEQSGYDGIMGTSVHDTTTDPETSIDNLAIDSNKNTIDEQGTIIAAATGDPHVRPIIGSPYDLPHEEKTFLLYSNNDASYPVSIKGKCWYLPENIYMKRINRLNAIGYHYRAERYLELFKENTYFKYLEFVCGPEHVIIDMDKLRPCTLTSYQDLYNHTLPLAEERYENNKYINLSGFKHSKTGIVITKKPMKTTLQRVITMRGRESIVTLRMIWDTRDIINRNGIEIKIRGLKNRHVGSLVRECVIYSVFGLNYNNVGSYIQEPIKNCTKVYRASSYGATENVNDKKCKNTTLEQQKDLLCV